MKKRILTALFIALVTVTMAAQWTDDTPAFHTAPPAKGEKLAPIMSPAKLEGASAQYPFQKHAYELAAKVDKVLYQQPCYCHCDKAHGHTSLRSCFETQHGANCGVCMKEAYYSYVQNKAGKKASEIRQGIMNGDYNQIDLESADQIK